MDSFINAFIAYFVIIDPIGASLIFNALTSGESEKYSRKMAVRSVSLSTLLVLCFGFWGVSLLGTLGIEMESFKIAGGLLIFYAAFGMITKPDDEKSDESREKGEDISVYPLSIPLIAGPGCLTLTILLFSGVRDQEQSFLPLVAAVFSVYVITLISFLFAKPMARLVGTTVNNVFKRLLGVLLASLAIQFIADGVKGLMV
ncbi:MAG: multiple antibiotic resistance protein [Desulforhopalus sp.]